MQYIFFYTGLGLSSGISASVIAGSLTFFQLGLAHFIYHDDRITATKTIAALVGFSGILFYQAMENGLRLSFGAGEMLMFAAMFCAALGNVLYRKAPAAGLSPLQLTATQMLMGGIGLAVIGAQSRLCTVSYRRRFPSDSRLPIPGIGHQFSAL